MIQRQGQVLDEYGRPVLGATIYVFNEDDTVADLTIDGTAPLTQPVLTDEFGIYTYYADEAFYREDTYYGGKLRYREMALVGPSVQDQLTRAIHVPIGYSAPSYPDPATLGGKFLGASADGSQIIPLSGTGADAALRDDLAATTGSALVKTAAGTTVEAEIAAGKSSIRGNSGRTYGALACVLRAVTTGTWTIIDDGNHTPTPSDTTLTVGTDGTLTLDYSNMGGLIVGTFNITPDEFMASVPLSSGASVGSDAAAISFYCPLEIYGNGTGFAAGYSYLGTGEALASAGAALSAGNTWGYFLDTPNGTLTINHLSHTYSATSMGAVSDISVPNTSTTVDQIRMTSATKTKKVLQSFARIAGSTSALASPVVTSKALGITAAWDAGTGQLTITTPTAQANDPVVASRTAGFVARIVSSTATTIVVAFDSAVDGTQYIGAAAKACSFMRGSFAPCAWTSGCKFALRAPPVFCFAQNIVTGSNGNFWIDGVMLTNAD